MSDDKTTHKVYRLHIASSEISTIQTHGVSLEAMLKLINDWNKSPGHKHIWKYWVE